VWAAQVSKEMAARVDQVPSFPTLLAIARESLDEGYADGYAAGSFRPIPLVSGKRIPF
jgi:hypothetical protein